jgi:hypothetical protein
MASLQRSSSALKSRPAPLRSDDGVGSAYRIIALTLIVTFALSFAYLYHKQKAAELPASAKPAVAKPAAQAPDHRRQE